MSKQREALEKALLALEIAPLDHNSVKSSFFEKRHYAIIALRKALAEPEHEPELEFWPGEILICKEDDSKVTVVHGNRGPMQLMNGKIAIAWNDSVGGEYTIEQIKEMFYHAEKPEQDAPPARKPLTDEEISAIVQSMSAHTWDAHMLARAIERAHGIGEE